MTLSTNPGMALEKFDAMLAKAAASQAEAESYAIFAEATLGVAATMATGAVLFLAPELFMSGTSPDHVKLIENKEQFIGMAVVKPADFCKFLKYAPGPMKNATSHFIEEMRQSHEHRERVATEKDKFNRGESPALGYGAMAADATNVARSDSARDVR